MQNNIVYFFLHHLSIWSSFWAARLVLFDQLYLVHCKSLFSFVLNAIFLSAGCLLRSLPTDIVFDNITGISFTCDLSDNIAAPWPSSSSLQSLSLCAPGEKEMSFRRYRNNINM
jgi:hypothetical protein